MCYVWRRYQQLTDNLIDAFFYHLKQFDQENKAKAKEAKTLLDCGKYEAAYYLKDEEMAKCYLKECIKNSVHASISEKEALNMEVENILDFAKSHYDGMAFRRIHTLLNCAKIGE